MVARMAPIWEGRTKMNAKPGQVEEIVQDGSARAAAVAHRTLEEVNDAMNTGQGGL